MKYLLSGIVLWGVSFGVPTLSAQEKWDPTPLGPLIEPETPPQPPERRSLKPLFKRHAAEGAPVSLTREGQPMAMIVLPANASAAEREAAKLLSETWSAMSGATLAIVHEPQVVVWDEDPTKPRFGVGEVEWPAAIWIGATQRAEAKGLSTDQLPPEGFLIRSGNGEVFLMGNDRPVEQSRRPLRGTAFATSDLLERHFGVRWLWPGELGRALPQRPTLDLPALSEENAPALTMRIIRGMSAAQPAMELHQAHFHLLRIEQDDYQAVLRQQGEWLARQKTGYSIVENGGHAFTGWFERYGKAHPDWFALQPDGTRHQFPVRERLCVSHPDLPQAVAKEVDEKYRANPNLPAGVAIAPNDGGGFNFFCMCEACRKLDPPKGRTYDLLFSKGPERKTIDRFYVAYPSLSDRYARFYNRIAEETAKLRPGAKLVTLAYHAYSDAPLGVKEMHPSLTVGYVGGNYLSMKERENTVLQWNGWANRVQRLFYRPNVLHTGAGWPFFYGRRLAADLKHYTRSGMVGVDFDSLIGDWATQGLNYYLLAKIVWDPSLDVDELITDYCRSGFGPAAEEVEAYFNALEQLTDDYAATYDRITEAHHAEELKAEEREDTQLPKGRKVSPQVETFCEIFTPERISQLEGLLEKARVAARSDTTVLARIDFLQAGVDLVKARLPFMGQMAAGIYGRAAQTKELREELLLHYRAAFAKDPQAINAVWAVRRDYYYLQDILIH